MDSIQGTRHLIERLELKLKDQIRDLLSRIDPSLDIHLERALKLVQTVNDFLSERMEHDRYSPIVPIVTPQSTTQELTRMEKLVAAGMLIGGAVLGASGATGFLDDPISKELEHIDLHGANPTLRVVQSDHGRWGYSSRSSRRNSTPTLAEVEREESPSNLGCARKLTEFLERWRRNLLGSSAVWDRVSRWNHRVSPTASSKRLLS